MKHHSWVFRPRLVVGMVVGSAACCLVAEALDLHLMGPRLPGRAALNERLWDFLVLWIVACSIIGWTLYFLKRRPAHKASIWPLLVVPLVVALALAVFEGCEAYRNYIANAKLSLPPASFWLDALPVVRVALPLGFWAGICMIIVAQANAWRQPTTPGVCPMCDYDLTGNESGVCPECGSEVITDPSIPHEFHRRHFRWMPELGDFPDAKSRYEATQQAAKECRRSPVSWLSLLLVIITVVLLESDESGYWGQRWWPAVLALVPITFATLMLGSRHIMRRSLRRQLADQQQDSTASHE